MQVPRGKCELGCSQEIDFDSNHDAIEVRRQGFITRCNTTFLHDRKQGIKIITFEPAKRGGRVKVIRSMYGATTSCSNISKIATTLNITMYHACRQVSELLLVSISRTPVNSCPKVGPELGNNDGDS
jgi:hypothetical protein